MERIILGYTGSLETSIAIPWLAERYSAEIIAVALDLGQRTELVEIRERALALGARRCHVIDVREEFVREYILHTLQAGALRDGRVPLTTALTRPLIVRKLVDIARMEGAAAIAHGSAAGSQDATRIEAAAQTLAPFLTLLAPAQLWEMTRQQQIEYARSRRGPIAEADPGVPSDANLWGRAFSTDGAPSEDMYTLTRAPQHCPDQPAYIDIDFEAGKPIRANGIELPMLEMIDSLETIAGSHGVGRIQSGDVAHVEAPAAVVLHTAHAELQACVTPRGLQDVTTVVSRAYADMIDAGTWFSHTREALDTLVAAIQPRVTGSVRLELSRGACRAVDRKSPFAELADRPSSSVTADRLDRTAAARLIEGR
jgi:argininosuccinate synthase